MSGAGGIDHNRIKADRPGFLRQQRCTGTGQADRA
jgi:hypothetical protein